MNGENTYVLEVLGWRGSQLRWVSRPSVGGCQGEYRGGVDWVMTICMIGRRQIPGPYVSLTPAARAWAALHAKQYSSTLSTSR
jgi:hypothetical protein